jgi:DNA-binding SARP family transcriptional activator
MDSAHVFAAKVRRPRPTGLDRDRLRRRLLAADADVVVLTAPAGAGKTTLLAQLAEVAAPRVAWYRAGPHDADPRLLARYLARALANLLPGWQDVVDVDGLVAALEGAGPVLLVLDDLHDLDGTAAVPVLERLLDLRPPDVRLLLASRRPLGLLPLLRAAGGQIVLDGDDLRFRSWEVEQLFSTVYGEPLPPEAAAALSRRTGGWAAGLQLFHLATTGKDPADRLALLSSLSAQARLTGPYLTRNVLAELTPARRRFLVRTAALGRLTGELCDTLLATTGSDGVLRELEQRQLFTTAVGDGASFRYHEVLRAHLELLLVDQVGVDATRAWQARAAAVLEQGGAVREAVLAYARAEDWASVARLVQLGGPALTADGGQSWDTLLPEHVWRTDPWLALAEAHRLVRHGALGGAVAALSAAEALFAEPGGRERAQRQRRAVACWTAAAAPQRSDQAPAHWAEAVRAGTRRLHGPLPVNPLAAGLVHLLAGRFRDAARVLRDQVGGPAGPDLRVLADIAATFAELGAGLVRDPVPRLEEIALRAEVADQPWLADAVTAVRSLLLDVAPEALDDPWGQAVGRLLTGVAQVWRGRDARPALDEGVAALERLAAPVPAAWGRAFLALAGARLGCAGAAAQARAAEEGARALGVPGAQAVALAALARVVGDERSRTAARAALDRCGPALVALVPAALEPAPRVTLRLLGGFALSVDGVPVDLGAVRPRARALLHLLALQYGRDVHREALVDSLWPGADLAAGLRSLHVALSSLRHVFEEAGLAGGAIGRHGEAYALVLSGADVDLARQADLLRAAAVERDPLAAVQARAAAVALYTGDLLPEDGPAEWVAAERERVRAAAGAAAEALAADCLALGRLDDALAAAGRALDLEPTRDGAWRLLRTVHELRGDPAAAARASAEHARVVADLLEGVLR